MYQYNIEPNFSNQFRKATNCIQYCPIFDSSQVKDDNQIRPLNSVKKDVSWKSCIGFCPTELLAIQPCDYIHAYRSEINPFDTEKPCNMTRNYIHK
jgi:hypothetical protein